MEWLKQQGPWCPALTDHLKRQHQQYDVLVFFTYLYATTVLGTEVSPGRSVLVPTAHDEPAIRLDVFKDLFGRVAALCYLTESEKQFVQRQFRIAAARGVDWGRHRHPAATISGCRRSGRIVGRGDTVTPQRGRIEGRGDAERGGKTEDDQAARDFRHISSHEARSFDAGIGYADRSRCGGRIDLGKVRGAHRILQQLREGRR
jgi:hypothetical protein